MGNGVACSCSSLLGREVNGEMYCVVPAMCVHISSFSSTSSTKPVLHSVGFRAIRLNRPLY